MGHRVRGRSKGWIRRLLAVLAVASAAALVAILLWGVPPFRAVVQTIDTAIYDALYRFRADGWDRESPVVIIAVDQESIDRMAAEENRYRWPWPRAYWGAVLNYLQASGAKVVAVDLLFEEPSGYQRETGDDDEFAAKLDAVRIPVIHSLQAKIAGNAPRFAPPVKRPPLFGAVDVIDGAVIRSYAAYVNGQPSLAVQAVRATGAAVPMWASEPFLLQFYNPMMRSETYKPYTYVPAYDVVRAALASDGRFGEADHTNFRDKIVLIGAIAAATYDLKSAPMVKIYPSVEAHATAIDNLLNDRHVLVAGVPQQIGVTWLAALFATLGAIAPRRVVFKIGLSLLALLAVFGFGFMQFTSFANIRWLPLTAPLLAGVFGTVGGLGWTYFIEDRQRRAILGILSQYVSPHVARELARRGELSLGGERREMTVLFTDIAGFTSFSERMSVEQLESFMNHYLGEVSGALHGQDGTVDKYIGDAVMCFWNAPLDQTNHAELACRAAIHVCRHERALLARLGEFGITQLRTRIGINTGPMVVGNLGSKLKANYTVIGDAVNLASRLEASNKIYGSQILVSESTERLVSSLFLFRRLDRLKVKGRSQPLDVYELLEEAGQADDRLKRLCNRYERALAAYQKQQWDAAEQELVELAGEFPDDGPTQALLRRVRSFRGRTLPADWDGVHDANVEVELK